MTAGISVSGGFVSHGASRRPSMVRSMPGGVESDETRDRKKFIVRPRVGHHGRTFVVRWVASAVCAVVLAWSGWNIIMPRHAQSAVGATEVITYTVRPGDTLWSYASEVTPSGGDVTDTVYELKTLNHLDSAVLQPGQTLLVPVQ